MQLTLEQVLDRLHQVHNDLAAAQRLLRAARDKEVEAVEALRMATARVTLSEECPRPKRGENGVTVADRDAWVDLQVAELRLAAKVAEAHRQAAYDHLQVARDQASVVQSLSALMRTEMNLASTPGAP